MCYAFYHDSLGLFHNYTSGKIRHYVLDKLLYGLGKYLVFEEWLNQIKSVSYFTNIYFGCFMVFPVNEVDTIC